jgi:hypothetical protein
VRSFYVICGSGNDSRRGYSDAESHVSTAADKGPKSANITLLASNKTFETMIQRLIGCLGVKLMK